ncbi:MAG: hypothetical protein IJH36_09315 [Clostridia bacterium]|nr:hypothetical protein [Clostridia bacterium]
MCYQKLLQCDFLSEEKKKEISYYLDRMTQNSIFTLSQFIFDNKLDRDLSKKLLTWLCTNNILKRGYAVRCPNCGHMIELIDDINNTKDTIFCVNCSQDVELTSEDIVIIYMLNSPPFVDGQWVETYFKTLEQLQPAVPKEDTLKELLDSGQANELFYSPSQQEYLELQRLYNDLFVADSTKEKGDTLEDLVRYLFNLCIHFKANSIKIGNNQIDCYSRNQLCVPGTNIEPSDYDIISECKNENKKPGITYLEKLHSILIQSNRKNGIIFSKKEAPSTYLSTARELYLQDKILIISIDGNDLDKISNHKYNFLECIARKQAEIILNAKSNLVNQGLYSA